MAIERFNEIQVEMNAMLERLKAAKDPTKMRDILLALRVLIAEIDTLAVKSIKELPGSDRS